MILFSLLILVLFSLSSAYITGFRINVSQSMPLGIWYVQQFKRPIKRGDIVWFCPPDRAIFRLARKRQYIPSGACPGANAHLLKRVTAIPNDQVVVNRTGLSVNGSNISNSRPRFHDSAGRLLKPKIGIYTLKSSFWLLGDNPKSFDSRYFGPLSTSIDYLKATPVFTLK